MVVFSLHWVTRGMLVHPVSSAALWNVKEDLICISGGNKFSIYVLFDEQMTWSWWQWKYNLTCTSLCNLWATFSGWFIWEEFSWWKSCYENQEWEKIPSIMGDLGSVNCSGTEQNVGGVLSFMEAQPWGICIGVVSVDARDHLSLFMYSLHLPDFLFS